MADNFDAFFARVLQDEGEKYEDVAGDAGGPTRCGVTIFDVARFNGIKIPSQIADVRKCAQYDKLVAMVRDLDADKAKPIYKRYYWSNVRADDLPAGLGYAIADFSTNSGEGKAASVLGSLVGVPSHVVNDAMVDAASAYPSKHDLITHFQDARRAYLLTISDPANPKYAHNVKFRKGWLDRESRVRQIALSMTDAAPSDGTTQRAPKAVDTASGTSVPANAHPLMLAARSPTVWSLATAAWASLTNGVQNVLDTVEHLFGHIDDIKSDVSAVVDPATSVLGSFKLDGSAVTGVVTAITIAALAVAIIRHVHDKMPETPAAV